MKRTILGGAISAVTLAGLCVATSGVPASGAPADPRSPQQLAAAAARSLIAGKAAGLHVGAKDHFIAHKVISGTNGLQYASYDRTYAGLPVVGGDFVVVTDAAGTVLATSAGQRVTLGAVATAPSLPATRATTAARSVLASVRSTSRPSLVIYALGATPRLAYAVDVAGRGRGAHAENAVKAAYVDAATGAVLGTRDKVLYGTDNSAFNGPNPVTIQTVKSGSNYLLQDPTVTNLKCQDFTTKATFSKTTDAWGTGSATSKETGCADALFAAQTENRMLGAWLGRNSFDGNGAGWPIRVGLNDENAYYDGSQVAIGHNTANEWISSIDVVAHEFGHGIDDHTPGGISGNGTQEFVADTFGASTEGYAAEPSPYDVPDYTVGEEINLVGNGPIRYMYNPSLAGDDNCYSTSTPTDEVHAAAGPGNHWYYLLAEGTSPSDGQPNSPTCNGSSVTGVGVKTAQQIMYNAMLMKTSASSYLKYRTWTLTAAKNLGNGSCTLFNTVKAAWDAVSVPAQSADPTCGTTTPPSGTNLLQNPGFESGQANWTGTSGPITNNTGRPARTGSWKLWLGGNGYATTETESQTVSIPAGKTATLTFWIRIDTSESGTRAYDTARAQIVSGSTTSTLATYSNVNANSTYVQKSFNVSSYAGKTISVRFTMTEDSSLQTSFVVDDTALTTS